MEKAADYIKSIEIKSLWNGQKHIVWDLNPEVNILSGVNGAGKSTILNKLAARLATREGGVGSTPVLGVKIEFSPADATYVRYDLVRSFDRPLIHGDILDKLSDGWVKTEIDFQLYALQRRYLDYQVNIGNRMINLLTSGDPKASEKAAEASAAKRKFQDAVDSLFSETGKKIDREWQQKLIGLIRSLNPHVQIVLTTHSPAMIMDGWLDAVTEVSDITK